MQWRHTLIPGVLRRSGLYIVKPALGWPTFATASETAEAMALSSVAKAWELAFDTDSTLPPVDTARELAMLLVSPFWAAFSTCRQLRILCHHNFVLCACRAQQPVVYHALYCGAEFLGTR